MAFAFDVRSLALFRVLLGVMLLFDLATRAVDLRAHYTGEGVVPISLVGVPDYGSRLTSVHLLSDAFAWQAFLFALAAVFAVMLLVGFKTRLATLASWFLLGSLHVRNSLICYEADSILVLCLLWSLFLPLEARWSLDRRGQPPRPLEPSQVSAGSVGFIFQVCFIYWFAALSKTGATWIDGTAVNYALHIDQYSTWVGRALLDWPAVIKLLTWSTLVIEGGVPFLLIAPSQRVRLIGLGLLGSMQVGFFCAMDLGIFPFVSLLALVPLVPSCVWDWRKRLPAGGEGDPEPPAGVGEEPWTWRSDVAMVLLLIILAWNVSVLGDGRLNKKLPEAVREAARVLHIDQSWSMFAPDPMTEDGWFVVTAFQEDAVIDLMRDGAPVSWEKPDDISDTFPGDRWKEFMMTAYDEDPFEGYWERYIEHAAREYFVAHPNAAPLVSVSVVYVLEETLPGNTTAPPKRIYIWTGRL